MENAGVLNLQSIYKVFAYLAGDLPVMPLSVSLLLALLRLISILLVTPAAPGSDPSFASHSRQIIQLLQVSISGFVGWKQQQQLSSSLRAL